MVKESPDAGRITKVAGIVSKVTDTEFDKSGNLRLKIYISSPVITESSIEKDPAEKDYAVGVRKGSKEAGDLARDLLGFGIPGGKDEDGKAVFDVLVGKFLEVGIVNVTYTDSRDGQVKPWSYPRLLSVGEKEEENVPLLDREDVIASLIGLTPAEGVKLAKKAGIRGTGFAEVVGNKNRVLSELGLRVDNGKYSK